MAQSSNGRPGASSRAVGDRTQSPGPAREPNWLPTSAGHPWFVILRMYLPRRSVVQARWKCPGLVKVS
jgi:hypothetical protein